MPITFKDCRTTLPLRDTIGNPKWLIAHEKEIKALFPETWTHVANIEPMRIAFGLKLLGVDWRSQEDFGRCMVLFEKIGFLLRDGVCFRAKP